MEEPKINPIEAPLQNGSREILWNDNVELIFSDVDETIAAEYEEATPGVVEGLNTLLQEGKSIVFITGQGIKGVQRRIIDQLPPALRKQILVGSCSGAEIHGFDETGNLLEPFYSVYDQVMNDEQKKVWRGVVDQIVEEFKLKKYDTMPTADFKKEAGNDPLAIMYEDRGPQITFEVINAYELSEEQAARLPVPAEADHEGNYDYRIPMMRRATELLQQHNIPITPRMAGEYAVDFAILGVNKTSCVEEILKNEKILNPIGIKKKLQKIPRKWKYGETNFLP